MRSSVLAPPRARVRGRALMLVALVGLAALGSGCAGAAGTSVTASGKTLTIYLSAPGGAGATMVVQDVVDAEQLAFSQKAGEVTAFKLSLTRASSTKLSDNARAAIQNTSAIAYLGEILPGGSADTLGITNAAQLLQVSPTDTALALTQASPAVPGAPVRYYESLKAYGRTFARVTPTTRVEARAQVMEISSLGVKDLYLTDDGSAYGRALSAAVKALPGGLAVRTGPPTPAGFAASGADGLLFATASQSAAARLFGAAGMARPAAKLFGSSALANPGFASLLGPAKLNLYVSSPGVLSRNLSTAGRAFVSLFQSTYHRGPVPQAVFGYEAMSAVLDALKQAGSSASNRVTVVHDFFSIRNRPSPLGPAYSIDASGDTSLTAIAFRRLQAGRLVPFSQVLR